MKPQQNISFLIVLILISGTLACRQKQEKESLFSQLNSDESGFIFTNKLAETEQQNILAYEYFYNGGGLATADFNNDGLMDVYMVGNQVENKLFLNKGSLKFEDVSTQAKVAGRINAWKTGVSLADVNADGFIDIYVCYSGNLPAEQRKNQLFINNGNTQKLSFTEKAEEYGLADKGYSTQAAWLDYDLDGDLDMFLINHNLRNYERKEAAFMREAIDVNAGDKLFKNLSKEKNLKTPVFEEVTQQAHIKSNPLGFGLGLVVSDINGDNWPDIWVTNDYVEDDYLYINQGNGTFEETSKESFGHTSRFAMGADIADINNDLLPDLFSLDMLPSDNFRQKKLIFPDNWNTYQSELQNGFGHQQMRNTLQMNTGKGFGTNQSPVFAEIAQVAGIANTDWSWAALFADFDNDGLKDLFVSNGMVRDYTDADFIKYYADMQAKESQTNKKIALLTHLKEMPSSETQHRIFKNKDGLTFINKNIDWGFETPNVASGSVAVDLDNDGDLEIITNNTNKASVIYKNNQQEKTPKHWIKINLKGHVPEGTKVVVKTEGHAQVQEFAPTRGFQSAIYAPLHFGIGNDTKVQVLIGNKKVEVLEINQVVDIEIDKKNNLVLKENNTLFRAQHDINFDRNQDVVNDFNQQVLLPQHYSYAGGKIALGDINADGIEDMFLCSGTNQAGAIFLGSQAGNWTEKKQSIFEQDKYAVDRDAVFFDADQDSDLDLYVVSGHYGFLKNDTWQADRLYLNDGKGNFSKTQLPQEYLNGSVVKAIDLENDGDLDLVVAGHVVPGSYPMAEESFVLINNGKGVFVPKSLGDLGIINDMAIIDLDADGYKDIVAVGEWTQPIWLKNNKGNLAVSAKNLMPALVGFWNSILADDLDNDGDIDFVLGNMGLNSQMKASNEAPVSINFDDFDKNGTIDPYMSYFIEGKSHPAIGRDEALEQVVMLRKKFTNYNKWASAVITDVFDEDALAKGKEKKANCLETCVLENQNGTFRVRQLPIQAQFGPVYAIQARDLNKDGFKEIILAGNNSKYRIRIGKMDANYGTVLKGQKGLNYSYIPQPATGLWVKGDVKDMKFVRNQLVFYFSEGKPSVYEVK